MPYPNQPGRDGAGNTPEDVAEAIMEASYLRQAERRVCPECREIGGHRIGCPSEPDIDLDAE